ncbi:MAG: isochorismatase family protein [Planctomycetaceae bacterium]|nr:isochorismatase family protein [Planctomycetaceae bacterium]
MSELSRSPLLLDPSTSALLVVDVQEKLLPLVQRSSDLLANVTLLMDAAARFDVPVVATEQYPAGLGKSVPAVSQRLKQAACEKRKFSCRECHEVFTEWHAQRRRQVVVVGIEAHVCVLQTVLDLLAMGFDCYVVVDATGSRRELDQRIAWQRLEISGSILTTTESVLFEWCGDSRHPHFKELSAWVKARTVVP